MEGKVARLSIRFSSSNVITVDAKKIFMSCQVLEQVQSSEYAIFVMHLEVVYKMQ